MIRTKLVTINGNQEMTTERNATFGMHFVAETPLSRVGVYARNDGTVRVTTRIFVGNEWVDGPSFEHVPRAAVPRTPLTLELSDVGQG